jgi:Asp/Glu/hydantoin racemase
MELVATIDEQQTKALLKDVLVELITEKQDEFSAIMLEAFEDAALANAIKAGRQNEFVDEEEILTILGE